MKRNCHYLVVLLGLLLCGFTFSSCDDEDEGTVVENNRNNENNNKHNTDDNNRKVNDLGVALMGGCYQYTDDTVQYYFDFEKDMSYRKIVQYPSKDNEQEQGTYQVSEKGDVLLTHGSKTETFATMSTKTESTQSEVKTIITFKTDKGSFDLQNSSLIVFDTLWK